MVASRRDLPWSRAEPVRILFGCSLARNVSLPTSSVVVTKPLPTLPRVRRIDKLSPTRTLGLFCGQTVSVCRPKFLTHNCFLGGRYGRIKEKSVNSQPHKTKASCARNRSSRTTSCTEGNSALTPGKGRFSKIETAKALAAVQTRIPFHRIIQARAAFARKNLGTHWALAWANAAKNCPVSADHLPPISPAKTANRHFP